MYRRLSIRLLCLALFTFFTIPAFAQYTRDNAATKKIDEAINEHYLATDFEKAESVLTGTITACAEKCSPAVLGRAWMYVGIVRGSGKNDQAGAKEAFQKAFAIDPTVKLDTQLATPETQKTFEGLGGGAGAATPAEAPKPAPAAANEDSADKGGLKCTPDVREVQTRRPIPFECSSDEEVGSMEVRYMPFGGDTWKSVKMQKAGDAFRGEIPCDATGTAGTLKVYVRAKDASGDSVDSFGSKAKPVEFALSETSTMEPPTYPGEVAPTRCVAKEECPPDFPGCGGGAKHGNRDAGASCDTSTQCKEGLLCDEGVCAAAPSCETNADCTSGSCVDNKCAAGEEEPTSGYKKNWIGLHFAQDIAIMGGTNVCGADARANQGYACYESGSSTVPYNGDPYPGAGISTGAVVATRRLLLSFDHAFSANITIGARVGFAFSGGPPAGKAPDRDGRGGDAAGTPFLPFHGELRGAYWFGKNALGKKGLRPYVAFGGGIAQVDGKVKVKVADCSDALFHLPSPDPDAFGSEGEQCAAGQGKHNTTPYELDAWRKMGQGFITIGGGAMYAFKENIGAQLNVNLMYMLPTSGPVIQPSLGVVYGF